MSLRLGLVVEGHGDQEAAPIVLRRVLSRVAPQETVQIEHPIRVPRTKLLKHGELERVVELAARSAAVAGPLIVAGDFNTTPYSPYFADWLEAGALTDSRRGRTLSPSWPTMLQLAAIPIDHVAVNDGFTILSHRRLPNFESDHFGALVEVALRRAEHP